MKKILLTLTTCLITFGAIAESQQVAIEHTITRINTYKDLAFIYITPHFESTQGCESGGNRTIAIDLSNEQGEAMYSAALAAASQKRLVGFGVNGCLESRPRAYRIDVGFE